MNENQQKPKGAGKSSFELIDSDKLTDMLPLKKGSVVLDLACGKGIYSIFLSKIVGEEGLIYAVDLWEEGLQILGKEIEDKKITNILPMLDDATEQIEIDDYSVDVCLIVAGWQYLQQPEAVAAELWRVLRPDSQLIVAFSNRMFFTKAPQVWADGSDRDHLSYVAEVLMAQGWPQPELIAEDTQAGGVMGWIGGKGDPFFAVVATKPA